jgi:hypothetical protein
MERWINRHKELVEWAQIYGFVRLDLRQSG